MKSRRPPFSHEARLTPHNRWRAAYGRVYVRTLNGQIWREENLIATRRALGL